jgi:hypothetical protein
MNQLNALSNRIEYYGSRQEVAQKRTGKSLSMLGTRLKSIILLCRPPFGEARDAHYAMMPPTTLEVVSHDHKSSITGHGDGLARLVPLQAV